MIYKIVTTINLAKELRAKYPEYDFVPVYWMATEDHDFDEIASFHLFGKTYTWRQEGRGAVGRMDPGGLRDILSELPEQVPLFEEAYLGHAKRSDAVRCYMNRLFGKEGLVCIDPDDPDLKKEFLPVLQEELFKRPSFGLVSAATSAIQALGYHCPVSPRELNLFYLGEGFRERIVADEAGFHVLNTGLRFTEEEMRAELSAHPEHFSPNVVLRPLYEELVLPNLAYVGGPSEIPYWMQLKGVFDHYRVPFPMLVPRNVVRCINPANRRRLEKLGLSFRDIFKNEVTLRKEFVARISEKTLDLTEEKEALESAFSGVLAKALAIDKSLEGAVNAERTKLLNSIGHLEKRIKKAEEKNHETEVAQLLSLKGKLFPGGGAQERHDNFLNFYLNDPRFIDKLLALLRPLDFTFHVVAED